MTRTNCSTKRKYYETSSLYKIVEFKDRMVTLGFNGWSLLYHIPNEIAGQYNRALGVNKGVPDLSLPIPRCGYHGLFIELKRSEGRYTLGKEQRQWLDRLHKEGYLALCIRGHEATIDVIDKYINGNPESLKICIARHTEGKKVVPFSCNTD